MTQEDSWKWDTRKNLSNKKKHGISFETAQLVFKDPHHLSIIQLHDTEERWVTTGLIGFTLVIVVHTSEHTGYGRIISARKATAKERYEYENGPPAGGAVVGRRNRRPNR